MYKKVWYQRNNSWLVFANYVWVLRCFLEQFMILMILWMIRDSKNNSWLVFANYFWVLRCFLLRSIILVKETNNLSRNLWVHGNKKRAMIYIVCHQSWLLWTLTLFFNRINYPNQGISAYRNEGKILILF